MSRCNVVFFQQRVAQEVLTNLKDHPDAWTRVDTILEFSQNMKTKVWPVFDLLYILPATYQHNIWLLCTKKEECY